MAWTVKILSSARRELRKLSPENQARIADFITDRLMTDLDPRRLGDALQGKRFRGYWRYRVGDYRLVAKIVDGEVLIMIVQIGHRSQVYR